MKNIMEQMSLTGKKALVTGGARGLNYSIAEGLCEAGADVVLLDISETVFESAKTLSQIGTKVYGVRGDLSVTSDLDRMYAEALDYLGGRLDILINGAGIQYRCLAKDFPEDQCRRVLDLNLNALFFMAQRAGRTMLEQGYGRLINIASLSSFDGASMIAAYTASKGGVAQLTKVLSTEWAEQGVNVNAIAPGYMVTELTKNIKEVNPKQYESICTRIPKGRWGQPEDLKGLAVFLASDASEYMTGQIIPVDGGYLSK